MPSRSTRLRLVALLLLVLFSMATADDLTADQVAARSRRNGSPAPSSWQGPLLRQQRDLPPYLDWRDNGGNWITRVRNQGGCGSCWIFSAVAATETWSMQQSGAPNPSLDLSEQYILSCGTQGSCDGGWCQNALEFMAAEGTCDEACFPYVADDRAPCSDACADVLEHMVYLGDYRQVTSGVIDVDAINTALQEGPLVTNFTVYLDFYDHIDGIYIWDGESEADGGHSVLIVGYDEGREAWLAKNSWGEGFGELGYFWIGYDSGTGFGSDTWQARAANQRPQLRDAGCEPVTVAPGSAVTWSVTYLDAEGDVPLAATLTLHEPSGRTQDYPLSAGEGDLVSGVPFTVRLVLDEVGEYGTRFRFLNDAGQEVFWPQSGIADLPVVTPALAAPEVGLSWLRPPAPNPANPGCVIGFELATTGWLDLTIHDLAGRRVTTLASGQWEAGRHDAIWNGRDAAGRATPSGTYFVRLRHAHGSDVHKISLVQ